MPYDFGNAWGQIGADLGAKVTGRPSARQAKDADRALAIKMAKDNSDYEKEQDSNKNFIATGGYNIDQLRAGAQESALMGDGSEESFKANLANPSSNLKAYMGFQDKMAKKYEGKLSLEDKIAFENMTSANKIKLKETQGGGTKDNWGGMGAGGESSSLLPQEPKDYLPWSIKHPFATMGTQSKEEADSLLKKWGGPQKLSGPNRLGI